MTCHLTSKSPTCPASVGPRTGACPVRQSAVPGAAGAAVRDPDGSRAGGRGGLRSQHEPPRGRRSRRMARGERAGRQPRWGLVPRQLGSREPECSPGWHWPRHRAEPPICSRPSSPRTTSEPSPPGWPIRPRPRRSTTSKGRCWRYGSMGGRWPGSRATRNSPPTWRCRASARSTWPISRCATCTVNFAPTPWGTTSPSS